MLRLTVLAVCLAGASAWLPRTPSVIGRGIRRCGPRRLAAVAELPVAPPAVFLESLPVAHTTAASIGLKLQASTLMTSDADVLLTSGDFGAWLSSLGPGDYIPLIVSSFLLLVFVPYQIVVRSQRPG